MEQTMIYSRYGELINKSVELRKFIILAEYPVLSMDIGEEPLVNALVKRFDDVGSTECLLVNKDHEDRKVFSYRVKLFPIDSPSILLSRYDYIEFVDVKHSIRVVRKEAVI